MKFTKLLSVLLLSFILFVGCTKVSNMLDSNSVFIDKEIDYTIDKVILSTSYQNTTPRAEITGDRNEKKLLIYGGLVECSNVYISNIKQDGSSIIIYLKADLSDEKSQLIVPQFTVSLNEEIPNINSLNLEVVCKNYEPIKINYDLVDIINKVKAEYGLYSSTSPNVNIIKKDDGYWWSIQFNNVFQKDDKQFPIINLETQMNVETGEIRRINRELVSNFIDYGNMLFYSHGNGFIYLNSVDVALKDEKINNLYFYDVNNLSKRLIFSTTTNLLNAQMCTCSNNISFNDEVGNVYIYTYKDSKLKKLDNLEDKTIERISWKNENELYLIDNYDEKSTKIYTYDIVTQDYSLYSQFYLNISNLNPYGDKIIFEEILSPAKNNNIYLSDSNGTLTYIDQGYKTAVFENNILVYLKYDETINSNSLNIFDLDKGKLIKSSKKDIVYFTQASNSEILIMENTSQTDIYQTYLVDLFSSEITQLGKVFGLKSIYDSNNKRLYINSTVPFEPDSSSIIYSIDADRLNK